jgi:hypothetical protein
LYQGIEDFDKLSDHAKGISKGGKNTKVLLKYNQLRIFGLATVFIIYHAQRRISKSTLKYSSSINFIADTHFKN